MLGAKEGRDLDPRTVLARMAKLGVSALNDDRVMKDFFFFFIIIIAAQPLVPAPGEETFNTVEERQVSVNIKLNEDGVEDLELVRQIAKGTGPLGRPVPIGHPIKVKIDYDRDGLIELRFDRPKCPRWPDRYLLEQAGGPPARQSQHGAGSEGRR
jgi:hypothetical protein